VSGDIPQLDEVDLDILAILQEDASLSSAQVAERVGISQSPTWRRITNLERSGVIRQRTTLVDRHKLGLNLLVFVLVRLEDQTEPTVRKFKQAVASIPEVLQAHMLMGDIDFLLQVIAKDIEAYLALLRESLSRLPGVRGIDSRVVVEEAKNSPILPIQAVRAPG
jgi:Lrp/AsnC family transcriptional regulator